MEPFFFDTNHSKDKFENETHLADDGNVEEPWEHAQQLGADKASFDYGLQQTERQGLSFRRQEVLEVGGEDRRCVCAYIWYISVCGKGELCKSRQPSYD